MRLPRLRPLAQDAAGNVAMEYALVLPVMMLALVGCFWIGMLGLSMSSLDHAVQQAARCMSVDANACPTPSATQTYAQGKYAGPDISPVFTASATGCGHTVTATASFDFELAPGLPSVPLSVSACYP
jgi:Flp pilus assembly protein TadG